MTTLYRRTLLAALLVLCACGALPGQGPAHEVDRECQAALPFAVAYERVTARDDPRVEEVRLRLAAAGSAESTRANLSRLAEVLTDYGSDLGELPAAPGPTEQAALIALVSADAHLAAASRALGQEPSGRFADHAQAWLAAAGVRQQATDALALRVALIKAKCS